ncbi:hypothetical protein QO239_25685 [Cupriavidus taiwanensis]|nr:hypothetical protein [Cupriavidus taiwanensis]MDK3025997.1 hypothetical protein [Cupriavidus taiwanensis]
MVERKGPAGAFWGCLNYPGCRVKLSRNVGDKGANPSLHFPKG